MILELEGLLAHRWISMIRGQSNRRGSGATGSSATDPKTQMLNGRVVEWLADKGYGFVATSDRRVFLHIREFAQHHKQPEIGDRIRFTLGKDAKGRECAVNAIHINDGGQITGLHLSVLSLLMILPALALVKLKLDWRWVAGYLTGINLIAFLTYALDKRRAWKKLWRLPE
ncbi:MAG: hypothetical protein EPO07_15800, partial [Verrucomicrobia bacterium]